MWPEIKRAKSENRYEIVLFGDEISNRINENGLELEIFNLTNLNYLNIHDTNLSTIPDEINKLINLQVLVMHSNKLQNINNNLFQLKKLRLLDLSDNLIKFVSNDINNLINLVSLNLSQNQLVDFPLINNLDKLATLDLSKNQIIKFQNICNSKLINLLELILNNNKIQEIPNTTINLLSLKLINLDNNDISIVPTVIAKCSKLKTICLKENPISDRRLLKLINQCRTKQIIDYLKQQLQKNINGKMKELNINETNEPKQIDVNREYKYTILIKPDKEPLIIQMKNDIKRVREYFVGCVIGDVTFTPEIFRKFIQLQNKLHDTICCKRNSATIATHDFKKLPSGNLIYTTLSSTELLIQPLNQQQKITGQELFKKLQIEANTLRKEKKRNNYSGIHKYLNLINGESQYPCVINSNNDVISFPPITNSEISKIDINTKLILIEITSSISQRICKNVMHTLIKEIIYLFDQNILEIKPVKLIDEDGNLKIIYPSKLDLKFNNDDYQNSNNENFININVIHE